MVISILTLFPDMFSGPFSLSMIKRAQEKKAVEINLINIRDFAEDKYQTVDDRPYGGGVGMVMKVDVLDRAITAAKNKYPDLKNYTILTDPKGTTYTQTHARTFSTIEHLIITCGHYEGVDARVDTLVDEKISIGNFVLTGGELPAALITDSVVRLLPGVLKDPTATVTESFSEDLLEAPQYTRPEVYKDMKVPEVLLSGNHKEINEWRKSQQKTVKNK